MDSVRENFSANECKTTVLKRIGNKDQQDNKFINKIKSHPLFKSVMPTEDKGKVAKGDKTKPKGPPPPPPHQVVNNLKETIHEFSPNTYTDEDDDADIPKTGFDFLDNW